MKDIATSSTSSTSAAMTENFEVYMWGDCGGKINIMIISYKSYLFFHLTGIVGKSKM